MRWRMIVGQKSLHTLIHIARAHMPFAMLRRSSNVAAVALFRAKVLLGGAKVARAAIGHATAAPPRSVMNS
jgi:hypothetical protein